MHCSSLQLLSRIKSNHQLKSSSQTISSDHQLKSSIDLLAFSSSYDANTGMISASIPATILNSATWNPSRANCNPAWQRWCDSDGGRLYVQETGICARRCAMTLNRIFLSDPDTTIQAIGAFFMCSPYIFTAMAAHLTFSCNNAFP